MPNVDVLLTILFLIAPLFSLIGLGWLLARGRVLSAHAPRVLSEFAVKIAMPALLFRAMLQVGDAPRDLLLIPAAYFIATLVIWLVATIGTRLLLRRSAADGAAIAMGCAFGNGVMLGFPLLITTLGPGAAVPAALLSALETPLLWIIATLHLTAAERSEAGLSWRTVGTVLADLARNPIIMSMMLGVAWRFTSMPLPGEVDRVLALIANAAVPVMLLSLGLSLAAYEIKGQLGTLALITVMKLIAYPALAWVAAVHVLALPPAWAGVVIAFASMPVGANAFMFAAKHERAVGSVSAAITVSTVLALGTITVVLGLLRANGMAPGL